MQNPKPKSMLVFLDHTFDLDDPSLVSVMDELPLWSAPFGLKLLDSVKLKPHIRALDLGCGTGFPLIELAQRLGPSCLIYGIDPWRAAAERVRLKISTLQLRNVIVCRAMGEKMPFRDEYFDLIVSNNGINNVENPEKVLDECFRTSRPAARMLITVNLPGTMREFYEVYASVLRDLCTEAEVEAMHNHISAKRKPLQETEDLIRRAGFNIVRSVEDSFAWRFVDGTAMLNHSMIRLAFMDPWKDIVSLHDVESIFRILEERLNIVAENTGELNLTIPFACIDCRKE